MSLRKQFRTAHHLTLQQDAWSRAAKLVRNKDILLLVFFMIWCYILVLSVNECYNGPLLLAQTKWI